MFFHKVGEDKRIIQRIHQRLTAHGTYAAFGRCAGKCRFINGKGIDHSRAGDDDDVLLLLVGGGQKDVELVGRLLELGAAEVAVAGEALPRLR